MARAVFRVTVDILASTGEDAEKTVRDTISEALRAARILDDNPAHGRIVSVVRLSNVN